LAGETGSDGEFDYFICVARKSGLMLRAEQLSLSLPTNIESFLYHSRSAYESIRRFLVAFSRRILEKRISADDIESDLKREGLSDWIDALKGRP
jgi:hypothetical protein